MRTAAFLELMEQMAPRALAESWDNVGVLVDRGARARVDRVLLTIDLTWAVLEEAVAKDVDAIVAYHPPIFSGVKRIVASDPKGRLLGELLARDLVVYSPHTALDSVPGGVNDWLADAFEVTTRRPLVPYAGAIASSNTPSSASEPGQGRFCELAAPLSLESAVARVKTHLGLSLVRCSTGVSPSSGAAKLVRTVAVCAGAGGGLLAKCRADLLVTGEMRHHDVLDLAQLGTSVILTDHTNCERGYLPVLSERIARATSELEVFVSRNDVEPLQSA